MLTLEGYRIYVPLLRASASDTRGFQERENVDMIRIRQNALLDCEVYLKQSDADLHGGFAL